MLLLLWLSFAFSLFFSSFSLLVFSLVCPFAFFYFQRALSLSIYIKLASCWKWLPCLLGARCRPAISGPFLPLCKYPGPPFESWIERETPKAFFLGVLQQRILFSSPPSPHPSSTPPPLSAPVKHVCVVEPGSPHTLCWLGSLGLKPGWVFPASLCVIEPLEKKEGARERGRDRERKREREEGMRKRSQILQIKLVHSQLGGDSG